MAKRKAVDEYIDDNIDNIETPGIGHNLTDIKEKLNEARIKVLEINAKMEELQDQRNEIRSGVKALGITKRSFDTAVKRSLMDPEKREELDESYIICCEAFGVPMNWEQIEMFPQEEAA